MMGRDSAFIESTQPEQDTYVEFEEEDLTHPGYSKVNFGWMEDPEFKKSYKKYQDRNTLAQRLTGWMKRIPIVGYYLASFWFLLIVDGPYTLKPRWGGITFSFLNDGCGATLWHTWHSVVDPHGKFSGIYTKGAPKNRKQAEDWESIWLLRRTLKETIEYIREIDAHTYCDVDSFYDYTSCTCGLDEKLNAWEAIVEGIKV